MHKTYIETAIEQAKAQYQMGDRFEARETLSAAAKDLKNDSDKTIQNYGHLVDAYADIGAYHEAKALIDEAVNLFDEPEEAEDLMHIIDGFQAKITPDTVHIPHKLNLLEDVNNLYEELRAEHEAFQEEYDAAPTSTLEFH